MGLDPLMIVIGLLAGILGSLLGVGGGFFLVPSLVLSGIRIHVAIGLSLTAILLASIVSSASYYVSRKVKVGVALMFSSLSIPGAFLGSWAAPKIPPVYLKFAFSALLFFLSYKMIVRGRGKVKSKKLVLPGAFSAGFLSGSLGIGGGVLNVPLLNIALGLEIKEAIGTSLLIVFLTSFVGSAMYFRQGLVPPSLALSLGIGACTGAWIGPEISKRVKSRYLKYLFSAILCSLGVIMILREFLRRSSPDHREIHGIRRLIGHGHPNLDLLAWNAGKLY